VNESLSVAGVAAMDRALINSSSERPRSKVWNLQGPSSL
jgi:hypothetical protein